MHRKLLYGLVAGGLVICGGIAVATLVFTRFVEHEGGPAAFDDNSFHESSGTFIAGETVAFASDSIMNSGSKNVELLSAELPLEGDKTAVEVLDIRVSSIDMLPQGLTVVSRWDGPDGLSQYSLPLRGSTLAPNQRAVIVPAVALKKPGVTTLSGIRLHYRVGDKKFVTEASHAVELCIVKNDEQTSHCSNNEIVDLGEQ